MRIPRHSFRDTADYATNIWPLRCAEALHAKGYLAATTSAFWSLGDWWVVEAEECLQALITNHWSDLEPDGKAFAAAWDQSDR